MRNYSIAWLISFLLQAAGTLWIIVTIGAAVALAIMAQQTGAVSVPAAPGITSDLLSAISNTTAIAYGLIFGVNLIFGLAAIGLGQVLAVLLGIEQNTRRRSAESTPPDPNDLWTRR